MPCSICCRAISFSMPRWGTWAENAAGADIYVRPSRHGSWPMVFLDDLPPRLAAHIADSYRAAVILTSPERCHLWLHTTRSLSEHERFLVQKQLVKRLQGQADPGSVSGAHWGRLPGFKNCKRKRNCWVNLDLLSHGRSFPATPTQQAGQDPPTPRSRARHADKADLSTMEWGWVCGSLEAGVPPGRVLTLLIARASARRGQQDAIRYARYTVEKACRFKGLPSP